MKNNILVIGGGISGISMAILLSQNKEYSITLCDPLFKGGRSSYNNNKEHCIRITGDKYIYKEFHNILDIVSFDKRNFIKTNTIYVNKDLSNINISLTYIIFIIIINIHLFIYCIYKNVSFAESINILFNNKNIDNSIISGIFQRLLAINPEKIPFNKSLYILYKLATCNLYCLDGNTYDYLIKHLYNYLKKKNVKFVTDFVSKIEIKKNDCKAWFNNNKYCNKYYNIIVATSLNSCCDILNNSNLKPLYKTLFNRNINSNYDGWGCLTIKYKNKLKKNDINKILSIHFKGEKKKHISVFLQKKNIVILYWHNSNYNFKKIISFIEKKFGIIVTKILDKKNNKNEEKVYSGKPILFNKINKYNNSLFIIGSFIENINGWNTDSAETASASAKYCYIKYFSNNKIKSNYNNLNIIFYFIIIIIIYHIYKKIKN